jgi:hypothetical protein
MLLALDTWVPILDGDPAAAAMYERHYSSARSRSRRRARGTLLIMGPGYKLLLMTPCRRALFAWRKQKFVPGVECAIFRNEGAGLSSDLIRAADAIADARWPGARHYTYVDPAAVANSNAGRCFVRADWRYVRMGESKYSPRLRTSRGLFVLERNHLASPLASAA